jgi:tetratricopeptide (TPR) repeat protein
MRTTKALASLAVGLGIAAGCNTPGNPKLAPTSWDHTRLKAALQVADEQIATGKFERARRTLAAFRELPDPRLQLTQARMDVEQGRYAAALHRLEKARQSSGETPSYHHLRGVALEGLGRWAAAGAAYEAAYRLQPSADLLIGWVDALVLDERPQAALDVLQRERRHFPGDPSVHTLAGRLHKWLGDLEAAIGELRTAALAQPDSREIRLRLAETYMAANHHTEASGIWQALVDESTDAQERHRLRHRLARSLMSAGRFDEARGVYRTLALTEPDDEAARLGLAAMCCATGESAEGLEAALDVLQDDPDNVDARLIAALSYRRLGQPTAALELLSEVPTESDADGLVRELLARWR